jgi:hypothetical protein
MATRLVRRWEAAASEFLTDPFQRGLAHWNHQRLAPGWPDEAWERAHEHDARMLRMESAFFEELRAEIASEASSPFMAGDMVDFQNSLFRPPITMFRQSPTPKWPSYQWKP